MKILSMKATTWCIDSIEIDYDIENIKKEITNYILHLNNEQNPLDILKTVLCKNFNVSKVAIYNSNPTFAELIDFIRLNDAQKKFALATLENETESIVIKNKYRIFKEETFYLEDLKKYIKKYIENNPQEIHIKNIVFNSLEKLTGYKANRKVTKYVNLDNKCIRVENPTYTMLYKFVQSLCEYQKNLSMFQKKEAEKAKRAKLTRIAQKERDFIDKRFEYVETHANRFLSYNLR